MTSADGSPAPFSRRRELGATSARSLLLTVLGEFALPAGVPVWTQTLLDALALVGVEEKSARQALARTAADGVIVSGRAGRRVRWSLSAEGRALLTDGAARIYGHGAPRPPWDGRWVVVLISVPESQRQLRHRLRTRLAWAGFGSPTAGTWVCPDPDRADEARTVLAEVGVGSGAFVFVGPYAGGGPVADLVAGSWDLAGLGERYTAFVARAGAAAPVDDAGMLAAQIRLVDDWRRFPFLDPQLPAELLPAQWPGHEAAALFHERHAAWAPAARRAFGT